MILKHCLLGITAILCAASLAAILVQNGPLNVASGQREILLQTTQSWNGKPYTHYPSGQPQLTTIKLTIPPHTALPWHTHPFPNVVYVLSGSLTLHDKASDKTLVVHQGQAVGESVDDIHRGEVANPQYCSSLMPALRASQPRFPRREKKQSADSGRERRSDNDYFPHFGNAEDLKRVDDPGR
jgi:quercetin dioxygenase-like cupin family protein